MRQNLLLLFLLIGMSVTAQTSKNKFYRTAPANYTAVNDFAGMLSVAENKSLSQKLQHYKDSTGNVVVIITQQNLVEPITSEPYSIEEVALHYFNKWGIGDKVNNNGVLIFVAKEERKVRIATGKGVDDILTDDVCQQVIDNDIIPYFKTEDYAAGLEAASLSIFEKLTPSTITMGVPVAEDDMPPVAKKASDTNVKGLMFLIAIIGIVLIMIGKKLYTKGQAITSALSGSANTNINNNNIRVGRNWWNSGRSYGNSSSSSKSSSSKSSGSSGASFGGGSSSGGGATGGW